MVWLSGFWCRRPVILASPANGLVIKNTVSASKKLTVTNERGFLRAQCYLLPPSRVSKEFPANPARTHHPCAVAGRTQEVGPKWERASSHSQHKHQVIQGKLVQVQFFWSGFWPELPNVGTKSHAVFVVHPNHRLALYMLGCVHTAIWPNSLTGSHLLLVGSNITWTSYLAVEPCSSHKTTSIAGVREQVFLCCSMSGGLMLPTGYKTI